MSKKPKFLFLIVLLLSWHGALAQDDYKEREAEEARQRQAFVDGMTAIVDDLNQGSFEKYVGAINASDMLERIFGLRLINQQLKRDFREDMRDPRQFASFIERSYGQESKDGIRARLLVVESRGDRGRAVVRFDMAFFQVNYIEYELTLNRWNQVRITDWTDYLWGHTFSERMGLSMVQAQPSIPSVRKLIDFPNVREQQVFQVIEVLKAARDYDFDRFFEIYEGLEDDLKRQRVVILLGLDASRVARKRRNQRQLLEAMAEHFPNEPLYALSLLDYYFPSKQFELAYEALLRLKNKLRIDDGVTAARLSSATLVMGQLEDADAHAMHAIALEPDLELGWWAVLRSRILLERYAGAIEAIEKLQTDFGHTLDAETLAKDPMFSNFLRSTEFAAWAAENEVPEADPDAEPDAE